MQFDLIAKDPNSSARAGKIVLNGITVETPIFMPVGTQATVKALDWEVIKNDVNADIVLGNTYHLYLRPGEEVLQAAGGLHRFVNWDKLMLTDSGGYQVYSLSNTRNLTEEGVTFKSHIDGSSHLFSPEKAIEIQRNIGADIIMAFDECTPYPCEKDYAENSMHMTHRWLDRCMDHMGNTSPLYNRDQVLFPIVQGSTYPDLRKKSAEYIASKNAEGNAIGGLSVGEPHQDMYDMTQLVCDILPADKPRYLMGVGTPENILECIERGVDMFDCVLPTRNARNGMVFTSEGIINAKNKKWEKDFSPVDPVFTQLYTKAYLRHLFKSGEYLAGQIASRQNLVFYLWLVREARKQILNGSYHFWKKEILKKITRRL